MTTDTHETAPTKHVRVAEIQFAYRRFGRRGGTPLLLLNYLAAHMDNWDPKVTNGLAAEHDVIVFDYPGVGGSSGEPPTTVAALTEHCVRFSRALGLTEFDAVGFSLGGMIAQSLGAEHPALVRRIILLGTGPQGGEGMVFQELAPNEMLNLEHLVTTAFFTQSEVSQAAGRAYIERVQSRKKDRDAEVSTRAAAAQIDALRTWGAIPTTNRFAMLAKIQQPTLIVHGNKDVVVAPINALLMVEHLPNAQLIVYPDASHGAQSQHAEVFLKHVELFLR